MAWSRRGPASSSCPKCSSPSNGTAGAGSTSHSPSRASSPFHPHCPISLLPRLQHAQRQCQQRGAAGRGGGHRPCPSPGGCGVGRLLAAAILGPDRWQAAAPAQEAAGTEHSWAAGPGHPREKPHRVPGAEARRSQPIPHTLCKQGMGKKSVWGFCRRFPRSFLTSLPQKGEAPG